MVHAGPPEPPAAGPAGSTTVDLEAVVSTAGWKGFEQKVARILGTTTTRNTRPGTWEDAGDIALPGWCIDCKDYDEKAWRVRMWWDGIAAKARQHGDRVALVLHRPNRPLRDSLVVIRLADVVALAEHIKGDE